MSKPGAAGGSSTETVKVMVRVRPMNSKEKGRGKYCHLFALSLIKFVMNLYFKQT